jgi:hypothetical protein
MITIEQAAALEYGDLLHHRELRNADGTPLRARVNGKIQLWKTRPTHFRLPIKSGLYLYADITQSVAHKWSLTAEEAAK